MAEVNYILHLNEFFRKIKEDYNLRPVHISLYMALFNRWNDAKFPDSFYIFKDETMELSRIASKTTYHRVLRELNKWKYIKYIPSKSSMKGSRIHMVNFCPSGVHQVSISCPSDVHQVVSINKHNKLIKHINDDDEYAREDISINIDILFKKYLKNKMLMAAVMGSQKISESQLKNYLENFVEKLKTEGRFSKPTDDFNAHFISWLKIQLKNQKTESYGKLTGINAAFD